MQLGYGSFSGELMTSRSARVFKTLPPIRRTRSVLSILLHDAILDIENNQYEDAIVRLRKVLSTDPGIPMAYMQLGSAYAWLKQYEQAIPVLTKAVEMRPDVLMPQYELGLALSETGDWEASVTSLRSCGGKISQVGRSNIFL